MDSPSSANDLTLDRNCNFCSAHASADIRSALSATWFASMRSLYSQGIVQRESLMDSVPGRTKLAGPALRVRRKEAVGDGGVGWGMSPFKPRECGAGERERVNVRRLMVLVWLLTLDPSELEAGCTGLGARGGFPFVSLPPLRVSALIEPRLSITVCVSSSVSSSSALIPDAELANASATDSSPRFSLPQALNAQNTAARYGHPGKPSLLILRTRKSLDLGTHEDKKKRVA
jgi:hypothetical protein